MPDDTQDQQQQQSQGLWPQTIGDPNVDNSEPAQQEPSPIEKQLAEMREMFERQQQEWQQREERYQQQFDMLLQRSFTPTQAQPPQSAPEVPSLDDLPDPIQNPTQFSRELAQRIQAREQAIAESVQQSVLSQMTRATALDSMWNRFREQHGELAKHQLLAQGAAATVFNELRLRGVDPAVLAAQSPDTLIGAIAQRMQAEIGALNPQGAQPGTLSAARTAGIAGGSTATPVQQPQEPKPPRFIEQIRKQQQAMGLI